MNTFFHRLLLASSVLSSLTVCAIARQYACQRVPISAVFNDNQELDSESDATIRLSSPPPLPKSNLEMSLDPLLISTYWVYDHLQPRTDLFVNVVPNVSYAVSEVIAQPTGPMTRKLVSYYMGYVVVAVAILFIAVLWPLVGLTFCSCRCCCHQCCYDKRQDVYSTRKNGACQRCSCGFFYFLLLLLVMGACLGCFISAVIFRLNVTSSTNLDAAAEATSSAYNGHGDASSLLITEKLGAASLDAIDAARDLGRTYADILRRHVVALTDSMMAGVHDIVRRLSDYIDMEWLHGANSTLQATTSLQQNMTVLVSDMNTLVEKHSEAKQAVETCVFNAQTLRTDIESACRETVSGVCSRELRQQLRVLDAPQILQDRFNKLTPLDKYRVEELERKRVGDKAEALLKAYSRDLGKIQEEAYKIASGSSIRRKILNTLNNSLGSAADVLETSSDEMAAKASKQVASLLCGKGDDVTSKDEENVSSGRPVVAKYIQPSLDYTFYGLMGIASLIGFLVLFMGFAMLAACAGRSYYRRASCFTMTSVVLTFLFGTILAICCLAVFLVTAFSHSELCRPILRQDDQMFAAINEYVTQAVNEGDSGENSSWPPELIFASSSRAVGSMVNPWSFSFGKTLGSCLRNANVTLMSALDLRLPQSRLADRLIKSLRLHLKEATKDAILNISSRLDGVDEPSVKLVEALQQLVQLNFGDWNIPDYPSEEEINDELATSSVSRLSVYVASEIGSESRIINSLTTFDTTCRGRLLGDQLPWLVNSASSIQKRILPLNQMALDITQKVEFISKEVVAGKDQFRNTLLNASEDLSRYLEVVARQRLKEFEKILADDRAGRCQYAAEKVIAASDVACRPLGIMSVFSLLLLAVVLVAIPLILCTGAPFAQSLLWPQNSVISNINPQMHQAPGFEGLPLLDLLPRYQKIG